MAREIDQSAAKPSFVADPDVRFGTTFLGLKYRDYSVDGESIMDKATGEIFTKRPSDGRVVSFFQNKKYTYDLLWRLYLNLVSEPTFVHPIDESENEDGIFVSTDYDLLTIVDDKVDSVNMFKNDITISEDTANKKVQFVVDGESNGFIARITTRDTDKAVIEWLTKTYPIYSDNVLKNAAITYNLTLHFSDSSTQTSTVTSYCRINDESCILFPSQDTTPEYYTVKITKIDYSGLRTSLANAKSDSISKEILDKLCCFEKDSTEYMALGYYLNISYFCKGDDYLPLESITGDGNAFIVTLLDNDFVTSYLDNLSLMNSKGGFITAQEKPNSETYLINNAWAELTDKYTEEAIEPLVHTTDLDALETYIAGAKYTNMRLAAAAGDNDLMLESTTNTYTTHQVDTMLNQVSRAVSNAAQNLTSTNTQSVSDNGIYIGVVSSEEDD